MESEGDAPQSGLGLRVWRHRDDWLNHIKLNLYSCYNPKAWNCQGSQGGWGGDLIQLRSTLCAWKRRWEITGFAFQGVISEVRKWGTALNWSRKMEREREKDPKKRGYIYIYIYIYTHTCIVDSFCCTIETNNIENNHKPIKMKKKKRRRRKEPKWQWI